MSASFSSSDSDEQDGDPQGIYTCPKLPPFSTVEEHIPSSKDRDANDLPNDGVWCIVYSNGNRPLVYAWLVWWRAETSSSPKRPNTYCPIVSLHNADGSFLDWKNPNKFLREFGDVSKNWKHYIRVLGFGLDKVGEYITTCNQVTPEEFEDWDTGKLGIGKMDTVVQALKGNAIMEYENLGTQRAKAILDTAQTLNAISGRGSEITTNPTSYNTPQHDDVFDQEKPLRPTAHRSLGGMARRRTPTVNATPTSTPLSQGKKGSSRGSNFSFPAMDPRLSGNQTGERKRRATHDEDYAESNTESERDSESEDVSSSEVGCPMCYFMETKRGSGHKRRREEHSDDCMGGDVQDINIHPVATLVNTEMWKVERRAREAEEENEELKEKVTESKKELEQRKRHEEDLMNQLSDMSARCEEESRKVREKDQLCAKAEKENKELKAKVAALKRDIGQRTKREGELQRELELKIANEKKYQKKFEAIENAMKD